MSSIVTVNVPARQTAAPRFTRQIANAFSRLLGWLETQGEQREKRYGRISRASQAAAVRDYALRFARHDPRFAADLLAAADRHERHGERGR